MLHNTNPMSLLILMLLHSTLSINISITTSTSLIHVTDSQGEVAPEFLGSNFNLGCRMPELYILNDTDHEPYEIHVTSQDAEIFITPKILPIEYTTEYNSSGCTSKLTSGCTAPYKNQMNWIVVTLTEKENTTTFEYLINCNPTSYYKPFEWGLFLLICFSTMTITASSLYSRAWSYHGFGINVTYLGIVIFNIVAILCVICGIYFVEVSSVILKIFGTIVGTIGVMVCSSESLWLLKNNAINRKRFGSIRLLDIIGISLGVFVTGIYWLTNGMWIVNDMLAICSIIASIKIFKIRSLKLGVVLLFSLLVIETITGLVIHYVLQTSYNNLIIRFFESSLVLVFPSITPEFYRKCAWIPVTSVILPGLLISYLRRFDKSRGTFLYLVIGYGSFYFGAIIWMIADMNIQHTLPITIIAAPIMVIFVGFFSMRRNELKTIWKGLFYDTEMPDTPEQILPANRSSHYIAFKDMTDDLKIDRSSASSGQYGEI